MSSADMETHKSELVKFYNTQKGFPSISTFQSGNCCFAVKGGEKLIISDTMYGYQFPAASADGTIRCNPEGGYVEGSVYQFFSTPTLTEVMKFTQGEACSTSHNPSVFMLKPVAKQNVLEFGIYDLATVPAGGWKAISAAELEAMKTEFIEQYNSQKGIKLIANFQSGNCCFAVKGGDKLTIADTMYEYQFPASVDGAIKCNPTGGYSDEVYQFYLSPTLKADQVFSQKAACATSHNPTIYMRSSLPADVKAVQFGLYDLATTPAGGWELASAAKIEQYKASFLAQYNKNNGIPAVGVFTSETAALQSKAGLS